MFMVVIGTFARSSLKTLFKVLKADALVISDNVLRWPIWRLRLLLALFCQPRICRNAAKQITAQYLPSVREAEPWFMRSEARYFLAQSRVFNRSGRDELDVVVIDFAASRVDQSALQAIEDVAQKYHEGQTGNCVT